MIFYDISIQLYRFLTCMTPRLLDRAYLHLTSPATRQGSLVTTYQELINTSAGLARELEPSQRGLRGERVVFMVSPGPAYIRTQWAIWQAGCIAVPLCLDHPIPSLQYIIDDVTASVLVCEAEFSTVAEALTLHGQARTIILEQLSGSPATEIATPSTVAYPDAMILHTSGTTGKPKGVVISHRNLEAQMEILEKAWGWRSDDEVLCMLPLHHIHSIVNVVGCALWSGATCRFLEGHFSAERVFDTIMGSGVNILMAVPTIYYKLIAAWEHYPTEKQQSITARLRTFRLMVSGSAALPVSVMEKWEVISGHRLLERYGMTEIGMAVSNPLNGERRAGHIGTALPGVSVRLCNEQDEPVEVGEPGEIQVKGDNVFHRYWNREQETTKSFTPDGWFRTGDVAVVDNGYYRILGRNSVDIIKSGGYKISALEIEETLRLHPSVADCSVVGLPDEEWGEIIAAAIVSIGESDDGVLKSWLRGRLPSYRMPRMFLFTDSLPRNAMGKVMKPEVKKMFNKTPQS